MLATPSSQDRSPASSSSVMSDQVRLRVIDPAQQATIAADHDFPPPWMEELIYYVQGPDGVPSIKYGFIKRLARAVVQLPRNTPRPAVGVGSDGSVVMEWDIGSIHLGIQIDPDEDYDAAFLDLDGDDEVSEAPLSAVLGRIAQLFSRLADVG